MSGELSRFVVWGTSEVPTWLTDRGAIRASDSELDAAEPDEEDLFDWVMAINASGDDLDAALESDPRVTGYVEVDGLTTTTCTTPGEWQSNRPDD